MMIVTFALLAASSVSAATVVDVFHRVVHPSVTTSDFVNRGQIILDSSPPSFLAAASATDDFAAFEQTLGEYGNDGNALYQVALASEHSWDYSSVKYCHLGRMTAEDIILHASIANPHSPHAIDYYVSPIPHNGACPSSSTSTRPSGGHNTTITLRHPHFPPLPELRGQPQVASTPQRDSKGEPIAPIEEKSFLQKYWLYIAAAMVALVFSGGADEGARGPAPDAA